MNTLLLSTNTTNCTTKNLKMMSAVIIMTAVFVFGNMVSFAQTNEEAPVSIPVNGKLMTVKEAQSKQSTVKTESKPALVTESKSTVASRSNRASSVTKFAEVKPYDKSTVVNDVTQKEVIYPEIPGFTATGNYDADAKAFEVAKSNLYQNNRAEYNKYFSEK